jgi:hypothetical protein
MGEGWLLCLTALCLTSSPSLNLGEGDEGQKLLNEGISSVGIRLRDVYKQ